MGRLKVLDPDELLSTANPVFVTFLFYAAICLLKTVAMSWLVCRTRLKKQVFVCKEDVQAFCKDKEKKVILDDEDVERVRRNLLNDIENVVPFVLIGFLFVLVNPHQTLAPWLFRLFTLSRILHTGFYQLPDRFPQPCRFGAFLVGSAINAIMAVHVIVSSFLV